MNRPITLAGHPPTPNISSPNISSPNISSHPPTSHHPRAAMENELSIPERWWIPSFPSWHEIPSWDPIIGHHLRMGSLKTYDRTSAVHSFENPETTTQLRTVSSSSRITIRKHSIPDSTYPWRRGLPVYRSMQYVYNMGETLVFYDWFCMTHHHHRSNPGIAWVPYHSMQQQQGSDCWSSASR